MLHLGRVPGWSLCGLCAAIACLLSGPLALLLVHLDPPPRVTLIAAHISLWEWRNLPSFPYACAEWAVSRKHFVELRCDGMSYQSSEGPGFSPEAARLDIPLREQRHDWAALAKVLQEERKLDPEMSSLELRIDDQVEFGLMARALDELHALGLDDFSIWDTHPGPDFKEKG